MRWSQRFFRHAECQDKSNQVIIRVFKHRNRLSGEAVDFPSLEMLKTELYGAWAARSNWNCLANCVFLIWYSLQNGAKTLNLQRKCPWFCRHLFCFRCGQRYIFKHFLKRCRTALQLLGCYHRIFLNSGVVRRVFWSYFQCLVTVDISRVKGDKLYLYSVDVEQSGFLVHITLQLRSGVVFAVAALQLSVSQICLDGWWYHDCRNWFTATGSFQEVQTAVVSLTL